MHGKHINDQQGEFNERGNVDSNPVNKRGNVDSNLISHHGKLNVTTPSQYYVIHLKDLRVEGDLIYIPIYMTMFI